MSELEKKVRRRIRRIDATSRWSRMNGWKGMIPSQLMIERGILSNLLATCK